MAKVIMIPATQQMGSRRSKEEAPQIRVAAYCRVSTDSEEQATSLEWYRVRKTWADAKSQKGAFKIFDNAKKCADENPGYSVFDDNGKVVYTGKGTASQ